MDPNKVIAAAATKALSPLGLRRDGKSRVWYDDHGWWAIVVEFQPSSWSRGSYLNVALSWMLYEAAHWSFDIGGREEGFKSAEHEEQFELVIREVVALAARRVADFRAQFASPEKMYSYYRDLKRRNGWPDYYAGVLAGLIDDRKRAEEHFRAVAAEPCKAAWQHGLRLRSLDLLRSLPEPNHFRDSVMGIILRCRAARNLDEMPIDEIVLP